MATTFGFYSDSNLTQALSTKSFLHADNGANDPQEFAFYLGSTTASVKIQEDSDPGVNQIQIQILNLTAEWLPNTAYSLNAIAKSVVGGSYEYNGNKFQVTTAGNSHATTEPDWTTAPNVNDTVVDGTVTWTNIGKVHEQNEIKLATTQGGLGTFNPQTGATPGAYLNIGTQLLSGTGNAQIIWMSIDDATALVGTETELRISTNGLIETAV